MQHVRTHLRRRPLAPRSITDPQTGRTYAIPAGGDEDNDPLEDLVSRLGTEDPEQALTDEELEEAERLASEAFDEADDDSEPDLDAMEELRDVIVRIREEQTSREEAREEQRRRAAEIRAEVRDDEDDDEDDDPEASDDDSEDDDEGEEGPSGETDDEPEGSEESTEEEPETVAAAANRRAHRPSLRAASARRRQSTHPQPRGGSRALSVVTAGDVPRRSAGSPLTSLREVGEAFADKADAVLKGGHGRAGRYGVATFAVDLGPERTLTSTDAQGNEDRIESVVAAAQELDADAIVAAGGLCAPVDAAYDLEGISVESRPIRDSLPRFGADRGGIRYTMPPALADVDDAVGVWTEANDSDADGSGSPDPATKPITRVVCGEEVEVVIDAITKRLEVGNFSRRTFPEQFSRWWQLAGAAHSRLAEQTLWDRMVAQATAVTTDRRLGASRDLITMVEQAAVAYRSRHRMSDNATLRAILPDWARALIRIDFALQIAGDEQTNVSDTEINAHFADRGIVVTYSPDTQVFGEQQEGALLGFPGEVEWLLFHEGAFVFLDGGTLDFGMEIRDRSLNEVNDVEAFAETFENVAYRGIEALHVTSTVEINGATAGTVDLASA